MRIPFLMVALLLAGCTSKYAWYNPTIDPSLADRQLKIDNAECQALAMQSVPPPVVSVPQETAPRSYQVHGTTTSYSGDGGISTGTYSGTVAPGAGAFDVNKSMNEAAAQAQQTQQYVRTMRAQANLTEACLLRRGWEKSSLGN